MAYIISVANVKGGVGKTTMVHNLSHALALKGKKVLMIDLDLQGNLSDRSLSSDMEGELTAFSLLSDYSIETVECIHKTGVLNVDIIASDINIAEVSRVMEEMDQMRRIEILKERIAEVESDYDYIIMDLHPSIDFLFASAMNASDYYLIPVVPSIDSIKGVNIVSKFVRGMRQINPNVKELGIVISDYDTRAKISKEVTDILTDVLKQRLFTTIVDRSTLIPCAAVNCKTIFQYRKKASSCQKFLQLAEEVIKRIEK